MIETFPFSHDPPLSSKIADSEKDRLQYDPISLAKSIFGYTEVPISERYPGILYDSLPLGRWPTAYLHDKKDEIAMHDRLRNYEMKLISDKGFDPRRIMELDGEYGQWLSSLELDGIPIHLIPVTTEHSLRAISEVIQGNQIEEIYTSNALRELAQKYIWNLELYRLTKDLDGIVCRWGSEMEEQVPNRPSRIPKFCGYPSVPVTLATQYRISRFWHRKDTRNDPYGSNNHYYETTIKELLKAGHFIGIDIAEQNAIISFK